MTDLKNSISPSTADIVGRVEGGSLVSPFGPSPQSWELPTGQNWTEGAWARARIEAGSTKLVDGEPIAEPGTALAHVYELAADIDCSPLHPADVQAEASQFAAARGIEDRGIEDRGIDDQALENRSLEDLRHLPFVTIDEPTSKDLDQALFVEHHDGGFRVWYAIADAAHFVHPDRVPGKALLTESLRRGSTFYMPGLVLPMLPKVLSEDLVSLNPDVDRRALVFRIDLDRDGTCRQTEIQRGRIRSRLKTSYGAVQKYYDGGPVPTPPGVQGGWPDRDAVARCLDVLAEVGNARMRLAEIRDTVRLRRRELKVTLDGETSSFVAMDDPRLDAERYNEQISLLANIEGARLLATHAPGLDMVQPIFRYHQPPDDYGLDRLRGRLASLAKRHRLPDDWRWRPSERSLADFLAALPYGGDHERLCRAVHRQVLLAGGRSGFDVAPGIHHGVGAEAYARFTAPMREVVGIFVHKETWEMLGQAPPSPMADDEALRDAVVDAANRCRQTQRKLDAEVNRRVIDTLLGKNPEKRHTATVMGLSKSKLHLQLDDVPIDLKVYIRHLEDQLGHRLFMGRDGVTLRHADGGRPVHTVGDGVQVRAVGKDEARDRWRLALDPI